MYIYVYIDMYATFSLVPPSSNFSKAARAISLEEIAFLDSWNVDPRIEVAEIEAARLFCCRNDTKSLEIREIENGKSISC